MSQGYFEAFLNPHLLDPHLYLLLRKTTINTKYRSFQYKILNNALYLNKILFKFRKVKFPLCSFCNSADKTIIH